MAIHYNYNPIACIVVTLQVSYYFTQVYNKLEEERVRLEALQKDWRECEEDIEEILTWLRGIRLMLNADIPNTYDDLQADLNRCRVRFDLICVAHLFHLLYQHYLGCQLPQAAAPLALKNIKSKW